MTFVLTKREGYNGLGTLSWVQGGRRFTHLKQQVGSLTAALVLLDPVGEH